MGGVAKQAPSFASTIDLSKSRYISAILRGQPEASGIAISGGPALVTKRVLFIEFKQTFRLLINIDIENSTEQLIGNQPGLDAFVAWVGVSPRFMSAVSPGPYATSVSLV